MTLSKGNHLIKVTPYNPGGTPPTTFADRVRAWAEAHPEGEITERDLAQILCPNESYVIHEVAEDVHYTSGKYFNAAADSPVSHVTADLKVIY
jgi:nitrate reductase beta subunit